MEESKESRWRNGVQEQNYARKLYEALRLVRRNNPATPPPSRAVRDAADRTLAIAAHGRTRWSRAILARRAALRIRRMSRRNNSVTGPSRPPPIATYRQVRKSTGVPSSSLGGRVRLLGKLVPGCRKSPFPVILDEARDYIAALEMQVKAMRVLSELLSSASNSPAASTSNSQLLRTETNSPAGES